MMRHIKCAASLRSNLLSAGLLGMLLSTGHHARAQSNAAAGEPELGRLSLVDLLSTNVTTASRGDETLKQAPSNLTVVTREQIRAWGAKNLKDVMRHVPGYLVLYDRDEWVLSARGNVSDNDQKYLILLDGHRMNSFENFGPGQIIDVPMDLANVKRIEVIRGPGSAVWGSEALAGVINILTLDGQDLGERKVFASATAGQDSTYRANLQAGGEIAEDVSVMLSAAYAVSQGRRIETDASTGFAKPFFKYAYCGYAPCDVTDPAANKSHPLGRYETDLDRNAPSYMLHFKAKAKDFDLVAFAMKAQQKNRQFESNDSTTTTAGAPLNRNTYYTNDRYFVSGGWSKAVENVRIGTHAFADSFQMYYQNQQANATFISWAETRIGSSTSFDADLFNNMVTLNSGLDATYSTFGPSLRYDSLDPRKTGSITVNDDPTKRTDGLITLPKRDRTVGLYAQATGHTLARRLHLTLGTRFDFNPDRGDQDLSVNPRAAVVFEPTQKSAVKLLYNTGLLRPANFQRSGIAVKPEKMRQVEAIAMAQIGPVTATATAFWQELQGVILIRAVPGAALASGFTNTGDYQSTGAEFELNAQLHPDHTLWGNVSLANPTGKNFLEGVDLNSIRIKPDSPGLKEGRLLNYPTAMFNVGGTSRFLKKIVFSPTLRFVGPMPYRNSPPKTTLDDAGYRDSSALWFVDATLGYEPIKDYSVSFNVSNLFDTQKREPISVWNGRRQQYGRYMELTLRGAL